MNNVDAISRNNSPISASYLSEYEQIAADVKSLKDKPMLPIVDGGDAFTEQDLIDMILTNYVANQSISQMEESQKRLEEIIDEA
ncbi:MULTISPECIES: hypothetical protein [Vibrio]|uniref:Uncharacterized protein n=1 Tax=Vibrio aestuarianus TaxID=28171 RepID=A0A9X4IRL2_9VIBR|nr:MULTISPECIES: hypothetical protein [Vibrio]MDE1241108.1 hypothetical protein [Vibrio aestuarianus]MDE1265945.1 hypothetical protein [Vibrio aestuarianus]MDE1298098.1 hypothetical protein [Vibrio aestuarianus]MDE1336206.1 hypothetical protein [Vibrio aestuarianus]MDF9398523.1 hypothetical protein [Vibrio sp. 1180_3]